jgi:hypothetical protein
MTMIVQRSLVRQEFSTFGLTVQTTAGPVNANMQIGAMIDAIILSVPASAANNVFLGGDAGVTITTGIEIVAGSPVLFAIDHDGRQLYEVQEPLLEMASAYLCRELRPESIPFVLWDISQMYLVASAATNMAVGVFKAMFI